MLPTREFREGTAVFPRAILKARPWFAELEKRVGETLQGKSAALVWGLKDPAFGNTATMDRWRQEFPEASLVEIPDAGHFIQEDNPEACATAIRQMLATPTAN